MESTKRPGLRYIQNFSWNGDYYAIQSPEYMITLDKATGYIIGNENNLNYLNILVEDQGKTLSIGDTSMYLNIRVELPNGGSKIISLSSIESSGFYLIQPESIVIYNSGLLNLDLKLKYIESKLQ